MRLSILAALLVQGAVAAVTSVITAVSQQVSASGGSTKATADVSAVPPGNTVTVSNPAGSQVDALYAL